jgi:dTDP-4-amino-4,6-dideoxygalactose transaminase
MSKVGADKSSLEDLAIFGGLPAFEETLHVGRPNLGDRQHLLERINDLLERKWLTNNGPYVREFEERVAEIVGTRNCIAMCNATVALEIAIRAIGLTGEVIVPSFTFVATAHALQWQEITPVFCDVDARTHNLDPNQVEQMITPRTTGIIGVHLWGRPCEIDRLTDIARSHDLKLLFDAAHAFACSYNGRMIGSFGDAEVFSFHAAKFLNTFEGGAVVTDDDKLATKIRLMRNFGFAGYDDVVHIGVNGKMSEVAAAMGLTSLESLEKFVAVNRQNYHHYRRELAGIPGVYLTTYDETQHCNYQYIVLEIDEVQTRIDRDTLVNILRAENVLARRYFYPGVHRMEPYRSYFPHAGLLLTSTDRLTKRVLCLPTGSAIGVGEISNICQIIRLAVTHGDEVRERWSRSTSTDLYMH